MSEFIYSLFSGNVYYDFLQNAVIAIFSKFIVYLSLLFPSITIYLIVFQNTFLDMLTGD